MTAVARSGFGGVAPLQVYEHGLTHGRAHLVDRAGRARELPIPTWTGPAGSADLSLVGRCVGPTLDIGCGPGRITAALTGRGIAALGVDISAYAVALTRSRGAAALCRDVFALTAGRGRWQHVLLADGNIGIGADPVRLLWHCRDLVTGDGSVLVDVEPPGEGLTAASVRLVSDGHTSDWFGWCWLGVDALEPVAAAAGLAVRKVWQVEQRWQAELVRSDRWR